MATILVIDHRTQTRSALVNLMASGLHRLIEAADVQAGLALAIAEPPDLVLCASSAVSDIDGFLRTLRAEAGTAATPVALYSAHFGIAGDDAEREVSAAAVSLARHLADAQETERRRLSRELHDRIGQSLTGLGINLGILRIQSQTQAHADLMARLDDSIALLEETVGAIEDVMAGLRPPLLDDQGLLAALRWHADQFSRRTGIACSVTGEPNAPRAAPDAEIALFRITQEALNNVAKHARASRVDIDLRHAPGAIELSVADDGTGFEPARLSAQPGRGMVTMRERAESVGGRFELQTAPGAGTRINVRIAPQR